MAGGPEHRLYQLVVGGGQPFALDSETLPAFCHDGKTTAGSLMLTSPQATYLEQTLRGLGCRVEIRCEDGKAPEGNYLYKECEECPWAYPEHEVSPCGWRVWEQAVRESLLRTSPAHRQALKTCPGEE